jgi:hypothetical protein
LKCDCPGAGWKAHNPLIDESEPALRDLADPRPQFSLFLLVALEAIGAPHQPQDLTGMPLVTSLYQINR